MIRRDLLKAALGCGVVRLSAPLAAAQDDPAVARPQEGDLLVRLGDLSKSPLRPQDIEAGTEQTMAWAMDPASGTVRKGHRFNQLLLVRFEPGKLTDETRARAADGVVAYSVICTHSGCDVNNWMAEEQVVSCTCHESLFDPKDGGKVIDGPARRALPALPLKLVDGRLVVAQPFTSRVGFEG